MDSRFAAKLGRHILHRDDWWNIQPEYTPAEWVYQQAMAEIEPFGDDREDIRAAVNTIAIRMSFATGEVSQEDMQQEFENLTCYLDINKQLEKFVTPAEAARINNG